MAHNFMPSEHYDTKFYQREIDFKNFLYLSDEQLSILSKSVYKMQEMMMDDLSHMPKLISGFEKYQRTLRYLTNPRIHFDLKTFDERAAYLIMMVDPNLVMYKEFLKIDLISMSEIASVDDEIERNNLRKVRNQIIAKYESLIREKIGFFDVKLLKYEEIFFKRFFIDKELVTEIGSNNIHKLMIRSKSLKNFNGVSDNRYEELVGIAQIWLSLISEKYNSKIASYSVTTQYKLFGLTSSAEQFALLILLIDGNLDMLRIYEEESMIKNIEERIIEQFGFFDKEFLVLEKKFYDRFCPEKDLSVWPKTKKR